MAKKGEKLTPAFRKKLSDSRLRGLKNGTITPWNKGKPCLPQVIEAVRKANTGRAVGVKNPMWKGDSVSYSALHAWLRRVLGRAICCQVCYRTEIPEGKKRYFDWANLPGTYERKVEDWKQMCKKCHKAHDAIHRRKKSFSDLPL